MDRFLRRRLAIGTVMATMILLATVAGLGTAGLLYYKGNFKTFKTNLSNSYETTTSSNDESATIENVVYNKSAQEFLITLTNTGNIGINLQNVTLQDSSSGTTQTTVVNTYSNNTIAFDRSPTSFSSAVGSTTSLGFSATVGNHPNRILLVVAGTEQAPVDQQNPNPQWECRQNKVTYGGKSLTNASMLNIGDTTGNDQCDSIWYLINPAVGSSSVLITMANTITTSGDIHAGVISLYNVLQQGPETSSSTNNFLSLTISNSINVPTKGDMIIEGTGSGNTGAFNAPGAGQTKLFPDQSAGSSALAGSWETATTAGAHTMTETQSGASGNRLVQVDTTFSQSCNIILPDQTCTVSIGYQNFVNPISLSVTTSRGNVFAINAYP